MLNIGLKIKVLRKEMGLTQEQFAEKLGVSRSTVKDLEINNNKGGNLKLINKLCIVTGKTADYFLNEDIRNIEKKDITIQDLKNVIFDKVIIYKVTNEGFEDIYKGDMMNIPMYILEMKVKAVGAKRKSIIDIQVF